MRELRKRVTYDTKDEDRAKQKSAAEDVEKKLYPDLKEYEPEGENGDSTDEVDSSGKEGNSDDLDAEKIYPDLNNMYEAKNMNGEEMLPDNQKEEQQTCSFAVKYALIALLAITLIALLAITLYAAWSFAMQDTHKTAFVDQNEFKQNLKALQVKFANQGDYLWTSVRKLGVAHITEVKGNHARRPLVLLLLGLNGNEKMLSCMAQKIAMLFLKNGEHKLLSCMAQKIAMLFSKNGVHKLLSCMAQKIAMLFSKNGEHKQHPVLMNGNDIANAARSKEMLDERLDKELSKNEGVVVITKIGSLSFDIASIFFKYCDNEGAPYPNAVFIFTLTLPGDASLLDKASKEITQATWQHLRSVVWKDGDGAGRDALIARIVDPAPIPVFSENDLAVNSCLDIKL